MANKKSRKSKSRSKPEIDHEQTGISDLQQRFVYEYLIDMSAPKAALRAGYSPKAARRTGLALIKQQKILDAIADAKAERMRRTFISADKVVEELARLAFVKITDVIQWGHVEGTQDNKEKGGKVNEWIRLIPSADLPEDVAAAISEIKQVVDKSGKTTTTVKLYSKPEALKTLAKHLGIGISRTDGSLETSSQSDAFLHNLITSIAKKQGLNIEIPPPELPSETTLTQKEDQEFSNIMENVFSDLGDGFDVEDVDDSVMYGEEESLYTENIIEDSPDNNETDIDMAEVQKLELQKENNPNIDPRPGLIRNAERRLRKMRNDR